VVAQYEFGPFGEPTSETGEADACPFRWQTKYYDRETQLYYFPKRYYDPRTGRWLSRDPLGEAGGFNLYAYCGNDPVNRHDPLGLATQWHHRLPNEFEEDFLALGFDIHSSEWGLFMTDRNHTKLHSGVLNNIEKMYNTAWRDFFASNQYRQLGQGQRKNAVVSFLKKLEDQYFRGVISNYGAFVPRGMRYNDYSNLSRNEKVHLYKAAWRARKDGNIINYIRNGKILVSNPRASRTLASAQVIAKGLLPLAKPIPLATQTAPKSVLSKRLPVMRGVAAIGLIGSAAQFSAEAEDLGMEKATGNAIWRAFTTQSPDEWTETQRGIYHSFWGALDADDDGAERFIGP
jgi:RHS repeat-associated protein